MRLRNVVVALLLLLSLLLAACAQQTAAPVEEPVEEVVEEAPVEDVVEEGEVDEEVGETPAEDVVEDEVAGDDEEVVEEGEAIQEELPGEVEEGAVVADELPEIEDLGGLSAENNLLTLAAAECTEAQKIQSIEAVDPLTVEFTMCAPDPAFEAKAAFQAFGIQPLEQFIATMGTGELLERPIGTGPYQLAAWNRGEAVIYEAFEDYWGEQPRDPQMVLRWATEAAGRLLELQAGTVDQIAFVGPDDYEAIQNDPNLVLLPQANPNIFYLGMTNTFEPWNNPLVRQAIAMGIDRERIVENFYPEGSEVPDFFTPCTIDNGCIGEPWYDFDPEAARALLAEAGFPDGFETSIFYRDVFRVYLPEPAVVATELQTQLAENLGITAEIVPMESGEFIAESSAGNLDGLYMLGWGADYPHVTNFLDYHFAAANPQFGDPHPEIYEPLQEAASIADADVAAELYEAANNAIRELVPMVPIAHGASADAAIAAAEGAYAPPFGAIEGALVDSPDDTFVFMQSAEPISLYCGDETDGETLRACAQVVESLLDYATDSGDIVPALAEDCVPNEDATLWTCNLREGVLFHDGSVFDANDVVMSYAVGLDASNPLHVGNTGAFEYFSYLWGLMNAPAAEAEE